MKLKGVFLATFVLLFVLVPLGRLNASLTLVPYSPNSDNGLRVDRSPTQSIVVPEGFHVTLIASGLSPIGTWSNYPNSLQDLQPGKGNFENYLYFIDNGVIYRIATPEEQPQLFAYVPAALVMRFGFDGDLFVGTATGQVIRVLSDGTTLLFAQVGTSIEGMAFDTSSSSTYGSRLFVSEWIDGGYGRVSVIDASGLVQVFVSPGNVGIETAGLEFCGLIPRLYAVDQSGTIFEISNTGSVSLVGGIDLQSQIQYAETLACSQGNTNFGDYLYLAEQGYQPAGRILRVSTDGAIEVFASGSQGFDWWGVTGLKFSPDGETLYVTDDVGRSIYAIQSSDVNTCEIPFFSQVDENWQTHPLRGSCSGWCIDPQVGFVTIGRCGCTLTSAAMVFNTYGAYTNPALLSDCMGTSACPYAWLAGASCSQNKARWLSRPDFDWNVLDQQLNQYHRPVILGMHRKGNPDDTHWVVVFSGKGNDPENYRIHDPAFKCGANISLSARSQDYEFDYLGIYASQVPCSTLLTLTPPCVSRGANPQPIVTTTMNLNTPLHNISAASPSIISGTVWLYTTTELTMTVEITATSSVGTIEEMLIWSDSMSNTTWQPFTPFVWLPVSEFVYAQFKDNLGNITGIYSDTLYPSGPPTGPVPLQVFLPLVIRQ